LRWFLSVEIDGAHRTDRGILFQTEGAAWRNAREPNLVREWGDSSSCWSAELRERTGW